MAEADEAKARQVRLWGRVARGWEQLYDEMDRLSAPVNRWICDSARLTPGAKVLDVAAGSGQPAFMAAELVGRSGEVVATDISKEMVEAVARRAQRLGVGQLRAEIADMDRLQFEDESFDAVTCRWGFMFSPQPALAMREARRVLKLGGRLATATWDGSVPGPLGALITKVINEMEIGPPLTSRFPNPLDTRELLGGALEEAGFSAPAIEQLSFFFDFASPRDWWDLVLDLGTPNLERLDAMTAAQREEAESRFIAEAEGLRQGDRIMVPAVCLCAVASKH